MRAKKLPLPHTLTALKFITGEGWRGNPPLPVLLPLAGLTFPLANSLLK